jgi:VanZ family protein
VTVSRTGRWLPVVLWAALIFGLSSIPNLSTDLGVWDLLLRKAAHATEYAVLGALLLRATALPAAAVACGILYAATDELHQSFVRGRHAAPLDLLIDSAGVVAGVLLLQWAQERTWRRLAR